MDRESPIAAIDDEEPAGPSLEEIARVISTRPWNAPHSDKTWVVLAHEAHEAFLREVRAARRARKR